jgi:hypothetical protein
VRPEAYLSNDEVIAINNGFRRRYVQGGGPSVCLRLGSGRDELRLLQWGTAYVRRSPAEDRLRNDEFPEELGGVCICHIGIEGNSLVVCIDDVEEVTGLECICSFTSRGEIVCLRH